MTRYLFKSLWMRLLLCVVLFYTAKASIWVPATRTIPGTGILSAAEDWRPGYQAEEQPVGNVFLWNIGSRDDARELHLDRERFQENWRYLGVRFAWSIGAMASAYILLFMRGTQSARQVIRSRAWLFPLALYLVLALMRLVFVPCFWVQRRAYEMRPEVVQVETRLIWNIGVHDEGYGARLEQIRYGLIFFEEFTLLAIVASWYAIFFAVKPARLPWKRSTSK